MKQLVVVVACCTGCHLLYQPSTASSIDAAEEASDANLADAGTACICSADRTGMSCGEQAVMCEHKCVQHEGDDRCAPFTPYNQVPVAWLDSVANETTLIAGDNITIDTSSTTTQPPGLTPAQYRSHQVGNRNYMVMVVDSLEITAKKLRIVGAFPLIILARGDVTISADTVIDLSSINGEQGAGAKPRAMSGQPGQGCVVAAVGNNASPAHGGTFGSTGGFATMPCNVDLAAQLQPGSGGGSNDNSTAFGGAGGGAMQITSLGTIRLDGIISAHGSAGGGGAQTARGATGGGGGGSGGAIALQANRLQGTGNVFANGGGGGNCGTAATNGKDGADGADGANPLASGIEGGRGGAGNQPSGTPGLSCSSGATTGGGGGSVGAILISSATDNDDQLKALSMGWSPTPSRLTPGQ